MFTALIAAMLFDALYTSVSYAREKELKKFNEFLIDSHKKEIEFMLEIKGVA